METPCSVIWFLPQEQAFSLGLCFFFFLFPSYIEMESPIFQFVPIASCPVAGYHQEKPGFIFLYLHQVFIHLDKTSPPPAFPSALLASHCTSGALVS